MSPLVFLPLEGDRVLKKWNDKISTSDSEYSAAVAPDDGEDEDDEGDNEARQKGQVKWP